MENDENGEPKKILKKLGGILINSSYSNGAFDVFIGNCCINFISNCLKPLFLIGCGLNVSNPLPTSSLNELINVFNNNRTKQTNIPPLSLEQVLARILVTFESMYSEFKYATQNGWSYAFEPFLDRYYSRWLHSNQKVIISESVDGNKQAEACIVGIDASGLLKAVSSDGNIILLQPDGNSFNMLKGLISRKIQ